MWDFEKSAPTASKRRPHCRPAHGRRPPCPPQRTRSAPAPPIPALPPCQLSPPRSSSWPAGFPPCCCLCCSCWPACPGRQAHLGRAWPWSRVSEGSLRWRALRPRPPHSQKPSCLPDPTPGMPTEPGTHRAPPQHARTSCLPARLPATGETPVYAPTPCLPACLPACCSYHPQGSPGQD